MVKFNYKIIVFLGFSLINCLFGFFFSDFYLFFFRQIFLACVFSFTYFFDDQIKKFSEDYVRINAMLTERYVLLRLETPMMLLSCCSVFVVSISIYLYISYSRSACLL